MAAQGPHEKIIKALCKDILLPIGVFQKGTSRLYLDDNGWYFTLIEFQPSGFSKGTHLNVAMNFLFRKEEGFSFDAAAGEYGIRVGGFIPFKNEEQFERAVRPYVYQARACALRYREFKDLGRTKEAVLRLVGAHSPTPWRFYYQAMICLMTHEETRGRKYYTQFLGSLNEDAHVYVKKHVVEAGYPQSADELNGDEAMTLIRRQRAEWHSKPSMKKMPVISEFE